LVGSPGNFNPKKISGSIFKNDPQNPISIIIEKEVK
jgi:hypothetical protein